MGSGGSSSNQSTTNTTNIQNIIETDELAKVIESSNDSFATIARKGNELVEGSTNALTSLNNTLSNLAKSNNLDNNQQTEILKVGSVLVGAGLIYYMGKNKIKKGKK